MCSITIKTIEEGIADYHSLTKRIIKDVNPRKKKGVADYRIEAYVWHGKRKFLAVIDACWFTETIKEFDDIHDASNFIKHYLYT